MPAAQPPCIAPGPPGHWLLGHLREFRQDVLGLLLASAQRYGDIVRFRLGPNVVHLINHPDAIEQVLQRRAQNFDKATRSVRYIRQVCGESLLTSNGAAWQGQRKMLQPFFHQQAIQRFADFMVRAALERISVWSESAASGRTLDMASEMMRLTYRIAAQSFFSAEAMAESPAMEAAMEVILPYTFGRLHRMVNLPEWFPNRQNRAFRAARRVLDEIVYSIIQHHRAGGTDDPRPRDLLGMLLTARDEQTGEALSDDQIRNQTVTFLLAGHETTSNALTWTLYLLAKHPAVQVNLREELTRVLGGAAPSLEHLPKLPFLRQVLREAMRLYPPIWIIERRVIASDQLGGFDLPAGSAVVVCPYTLHRHPAFWERPLEFIPERFAQNVPRAYLPFGAGPRYCIGSEFALLEAQLILALLIQSFELELVDHQPIEPRPGITLRTLHGLPLRLRQRHRRM